MKVNFRGLAFLATLGIIMVACIVGCSDKMDTSLGPPAPPDTTVRVDTLYVIDSFAVIDTVNVVDTVVEVDTVFKWDTIVEVDTVTIYEHTVDTVTIYEHTIDTVIKYVPTYIYEYDTTYIVDSIPVFIYDTTWIELPPDTIFDTTIVTEWDTIFDTTIIHDTTWMPPDTVWMPPDTVTEYVYDTTYIEITDTLFITDTLYWPEGWTVMCCGGPGEKCECNDGSERWLKPRLVPDCAVQWHLDEGWHVAYPEDPCLEGWRMWMIEEWCRPNN